MYKEDLALNNLQRSIYHKTQPTNQPSLLTGDRIPTIFQKIVHVFNLNRNSLFNKTNFKLKDDLETNLEAPSCLNQIISIYGHPAMLVAFS